MPRIYPNAPVPGSSALCVSNFGASEEPATLTVWLKSLMFNCCGFTVYDGRGNLAFRVDNYSSSNLNEIVLMDAVGIPLFTIRRKPLLFRLLFQRFTLTDQWNIYEGEMAAWTKPRFSACKHAALIRSKSLAHVSSCGEAGEVVEWIYGVEGSFSQRRCVVYNKRHQSVAEIKRKELVGGDVFCLVVQPGFDAAIAMAIVVLLERMFGSRD